MTTFLYDTDVFVDFLRGDKASFTYLNSQKELHCSVITASELIQGAQNNQSKKMTQLFINRLTIIPISPKSSELMYQLVFEFSLTKGLKIPDALIAATAIERKYTLITGNGKHYNFIKGLSLRDWRVIKTK